MTNRLGWDAATIGNHEFDLGERELAQSLKASAFPTLAANIVRSGPFADVPPEKFTGEMLRRVDGMVIGIFGLANEKECKEAGRCRSVAYLPTLEAARAAVERLKAQGARVIVALTHQGYQDDIALAQAVEGIDVVVGGHSHSLLGTDHPESEGPYPTVVPHANGAVTLVAQAKRSTEYLGRITAVFNDAGEVQAWTGEPIRLLPALPRDAAVSSEVRAVAADIAALRREILAQNPYDTVDGIDACREGECLTGMLTVDAMLDYARPFGAEIAVINSGAVRAALPVGDIDRGAVEEIHPFGNAVVMLELTGQVLREALENGLADPDVAGPHLLQPAGLRYGVNAAAPAGKRLLWAQVQAAEGGWAPLEDGVRYRVAVLDFLAKGGDGYAMFAQAKRIASDEALLTDVFAKWLARRGVIALPEAGRIVGMPKDPHPTAALKR